MLHTTLRLLKEHHLGLTKENKMSCQFIIDNEGVGASGLLTMNGEIQ